MPNQNDIPVYLIAGFLDSGKTDFINSVLSDGFAAQDVLPHERVHIHADAAEAASAGRHDGLRRLKCLARLQQPGKIRGIDAGHQPRLSVCVYFAGFIVIAAVDQVHADAAARGLRRAVAEQHRERICTVRRRSGVGGTHVASRDERNVMRMHLPGPGAVERAHDPPGVFEVQHRAHQPVDPDRSGAFIHQLRAAADAVAVLVNIVMKLQHRVVETVAQRDGQVLRGTFRVRTGQCHKLRLRVRHLRGLEQEVRSPVSVSVDQAHERFADIAASARRHLQPEILQRQLRVFRVV